MEQFWTWSKVDAIDGSGDPISGSERCTYFDKELWLKLGNIMFKKHRSTFQGHVKYTNNEIVKPFRVGIIQYARHTCDTLRIQVPTTTFNNGAEVR